MLSVIRGDVCRTRGCLSYGGMSVVAPLGGYRSRPDTFIIAVSRPQGSVSEESCLPRFMSPVYPEWKSQFSLSRASLVHDTFFRCIPCNPRGVLRPSPTRERRLSAVWSRREHSSGLASFKRSTGTLCWQGPPRWTRFGQSLLKCRLCSSGSLIQLFLRSAICMAKVLRYCWCDQQTGSVC